MNDKSFTCCIVGDMFDYKPLGWNPYGRYVKIAKRLIDLEFRTCVTFGYNNFICGFINDTQIEAGKILLDIKNENDKVNIKVLTPFQDFIKKEEDWFIDRRKSIVNKISNEDIFSERKNFDLNDYYNYIFNNSSFAIIFAGALSENPNYFIEKAKNLKINYIVIYPYSCYDDGILKVT